MNNVNLNSEHFEKAAHALSRSLDNFKVSDLEQCVRIFEQSVNRMARIAGMQAANAHAGCIHYTEQDFNNA